MIATRQVLPPPPVTQGPITQGPVTQGPVTQGPVTRAVTDPDGVVVTSVTRFRQGTASLVEVRGEIDVDTVHLLHTVLLCAVERSERVCCDLSGVTLLSAAGCTALVAARRLATATGRTLTIRGADGTTRRVLEVTGLDQALTD